jgi:hypothetical protein
MVLAWGILHLADDRQQVIKRINELLKPRTSDLCNGMPGREEVIDYFSVVRSDENRNISHHAQVLYRH